MIQLACPHCGVTAEETEFAPGGEAFRPRASPGASDEAFAAYLYDRRNPRGVHVERWRHAFGCGKWFLCARDTATLQVFATFPANLTAVPPEALAAIRTHRPGWTPPESEGPEVRA